MALQLFVFWSHGVLYRDLELDAFGVSVLSLAAGLIIFQSRRYGLNIATLLFWVYFFVLGMLSVLPGTLLYVLVPRPEFSGELARLQYLLLFLAITSFPTVWLICSKLKLTLPEAPGREESRLPQRPSDL